MSTLRFLLAGLRHYLGMHLGVGLGAAVASAVLVGALCVGDSVRSSLAGQAAARIGRMDGVVFGGERFFRDQLANDMGAAEQLDCAPVLLLPAVAATPRGDRRVPDVRLGGVDERFFALSPSGASPLEGGRRLGPAEALLSPELARRLGTDSGDTLVLRVDPPSAVPRDLSLSNTDPSVALRVQVAGIAGEDAFGSFALDTSPGAPANLFVDLAWMQAELDLGPRANLVLVKVRAFEAEGLAPLERALTSAWTLADASLKTEPLDGGQRELVTERLFLDEPVAAALEDFDAAPLTGVFTYFVNRIALGERSIPYSMVSAIGPLGAGGASLEARDPLLALSAGLGPNELRLNDWAAKDLAPEPGAELRLDYYTVDASRRLVEASASFSYAGSMPLAGTAAGEELMPAFPGLADAESCRDWEPGTPVDLEAIRDEDEAYWDEYRGTPKAFLNLETGIDLWTSRFGALSGVRVAPEHEAALLAHLRENLSPAELGLVPRDVRTPASLSSNSPTDFGGLFLGLSFFLIAAAVLLTTQLFLFGVEGRASEHGLLLALGVGRSKLRRLVAGEAGLVALLGVLLGAPLGLALTRLVLAGLDSLWADAVARMSIAFDWTPKSLVIGALAAWLTTLLSILWGVRRAVAAPIAGLLAARQGVAIEQRPVSAWRTWAICAIAAAGALIALVLVDPAGGPAASGAFFGAGAGVLFAGLWLLRLWLHGASTRSPLAGPLVLGFTNARRRPGRSLASAALVASGAFLVLAVGANRLGTPADPLARDTGTGGFAFYGTTSLPLAQDLETVEGLDAFGLEEADLAGASFVRLRRRDGDDASCLSLAKAAAPPLLGVDSDALAARKAFPFASTIEDRDSPWSLLEMDLGPDVVPAIGDATSLTWQLKVGIGDELDYVDERGRAFRVRIVGALADTILQGDLLLSEERFQERYPTQGGYRRLLVDVDPERAAELRDTLTSALSDLGLALEPSAERLDRFHGVQNTYLSIFQALGALGLLLGSVGLGLVVLRNTQERSAELALMGALGIARRRVRAVITAEYGMLLAWGLGAAALASLVAMVPLLAGTRPGEALRQAGLLVAAIGGTGLISILIVVWFLARRPPLRALREE